MDAHDQFYVCRAIAKTCFWGHGGIGSVLLEELQEKYPMEPSWDKVYRDNYRCWKYEFIGTITDKEELRRLLDKEYRLVNYEPGEISVHRPSNQGGGLYKYIVGEWADELGKKYDRWNFGVYERREAKGESA